MLATITFGDVLMTFGAGFGLGFLGGALFCVWVCGGFKRRPKK